jgi:GNAT superfamily N-acetyltransferase
MIVRNARLQDERQIREVTLAAFQEYAAAMGSNWELYRRNILQTLADVHPAEQIVAEQDGQLVGTVLLYPPGSVHVPGEAAALVAAYPLVRLLAVIPAARGHGIGEALMQECIRRAPRAGPAVLILHTDEIMQAAMRLYARLGFVRVAALDYQPAPGIDLQGYRLDLPAPG